MLKIKKSLGMSFLGLILITTFSLVDTKAHADWNKYYCDIDNTTFSGLVAAIDDYNNNDLCDYAILFMKDGCMNMKTAIHITKIPEDYGTIIRGAYPVDGETSEYEIEKPVKMILNTSALGSCPFVIRTGASIRVNNLTIITNDVDKVFCDENGEPLYKGIDENGHVSYQSNLQEETVYITETVTIKKGYKTNLMCTLPKRIIRSNIKIEKASGNKKSFIPKEKPSSVRNLRV